MGKAAPCRVGSAGKRAGDPPPAFVDPQLALLRKEPPSGPSWVHELKLHGYRIAGQQLDLATADADMD
jgi:ATP-dependent DNA ligase